MCPWARPLSGELLSAFVLYIFALHLLIVSVVLLFVFPSLPIVNKYPYLLNVSARFVFLSLVRHDA